MKRFINVELNSINMPLVNKIKDYFSVSWLQQGLVATSGSITTSFMLKPDKIALDYAVIGVNLFSVLYNESMAVKQYVSMNRFENAIEEHEYDARLAKPFMKTYCGRKIVKKVLEKNNLSSEYKSLTK